MKFTGLSVLKVSPVILLLSWSVSGAHAPQESGQTMSADEIVERLVRAQAAEIDILVRLKSGGCIHGRVVEVSRRSFILRFGPRKHGGLPATIEYNRVASVKQYNRLASVLMTVRDRALFGAALVPFVSASGLYYFLTGNALHF